MDRSPGSPAKDPTDANPSAERSAGDPVSSGISRRSVVLGTLGVAAVSAAVPFNDYVVGNSFLVGSFLPTILVLFVFVFVVVINAPLHRLAPRFALRGRELAVALAMMLVGASVPGQGLLRSLIPTMVTPLYHGQLKPGFWQAICGMNLPTWLFVAPLNSTGQSSDVVSFFIGRLPAGESIPWAAWIGPLCGWGVFIAAMFATFLGLAVILRWQWLRNERLPFPLAELQAQLVEDPAPGRSLNALFSSRLFWIAATIVFLIHATEALAGYYPQSVPEIPTRFDLSSVLTEPPLSFLPVSVKAARLFFVFVGVMILVPQRVSLSAWSIFLILQFIAAFTQGGEVSLRATAPQHLGGSIVWAIMLIYLGRAHWLLVLRHLVRGPAPGSSNNFRTPAVLVLAGLLVMFGWLFVVGVSFGVSLLIVSMLLLAHVLVARIVAETGLPIIRTQIAPMQILSLTPADSLAGKDVFLAGLSEGIGAYTTRESSLTFAQHGLQIIDRRAASFGKPILILLAWAFAVSFVSGSFSSISAYYHFDIPAGQPGTDQPVINKHALLDFPVNAWINPVIQHAGGRFNEPKPDPVNQLLIGGAAVATLQLLSIRFAGWPLAPVGFIIATSPYGGWIWFSALVGWLVKGSLIRLGGGPSLLTRSRPFFIGMIVGSVLAVGFWTIFNLIRLAMHLPTQPIRFLPT